MDWQDRPVNKSQTYQTTGLGTEIIYQQQFFFTLSLLFVSTIHKYKELTKKTIKKHLSENLPGIHEDLLNYFYGSTPRKRVNKMKKRPRIK